jgi:hypothetical protein
MPVNVNWELRGCCDRDQRIFIAAIGVSTVVILLVSASPSPTPPPILSLPGCFVLFSSLATPGGVGVLARRGLTV